MRSEAFQWFVRGVGFALGVALVATILASVALAGRVVVLVFIALLLASGIEPVVDWVRGRFRPGRGASVLLVYAAFFVAVVGFALVVVPGAIAQFNDLGTRLAPILANARDWAATIEPRALSDSLGAIIDALHEALNPRTGAAPDPDAVIEVGITVADMAISVASVLAMVFFWLTERARLQRFALALVPADRRGGLRDAWNTIEMRLGSWVRGQLILMGSMGLMTGIAYFLIGLEGALLLAVIAALTEAIPIVGPVLGAAPALLVAAMTGRVELVLIVAVVYMVVQIVESNILLPLVMRNTIGIPPFLVIVSILAGAAIGGIIGALMAVPVAAALLVVLERLQDRDATVNIERHAVDADAVTADPTAAEELARDKGRRRAPDEATAGDAGAA